MVVEDIKEEIVEVVTKEEIVVVVVAEVEEVVVVVEVAGKAIGVALILGNIFLALDL